MARVKTIKVKDKPKSLSEFPNFSANGSIKGMKEQYYGRDALLVRCGSYIYNVTADPSIYYNLAY